MGSSSESFPLFGLGQSMANVQVDEVLSGWRRLEEFLIDFTFAL